MTLLFRNYYIAMPIDLFKAARIDGGGFWTIFLRLIIPMSGPILVVATILQVTGIWNDFLFGLIFAGRENLPMTVELNNVVNTTTGTRAYNVNMAATILTALVPLIVYFVSGPLVRPRHRGRRRERMNGMENDCASRPTTPSVSATSPSASARSRSSRTCRSTSGRGNSSSCWARRAAASRPCSTR